MSAFQKVYEIVTGAAVKNGHALRNMQNMDSLIKAQKELTSMMKGKR